DIPLIDYVSDPLGFAVSEQSGIYHLPTWRMALLPDNFFDTAICVQVLPELGDRTLIYVLRQIDRTLKPGGILYIRDQDLDNRAGHRYDTEAILPHLGFDRELRGYLRDWNVRDRTAPADVLGIPRLWRKGRAERRRDFRFTDPPRTEIVGSKRANATM